MFQWLVVIKFGDHLAKSYKSSFDNQVNKLVLPSWILGEFPAWVYPTNADESPPRNTDESPPTNDKTDGI